MKQINKKLWAIVFATGTFIGLVFAFLGQQVNLNRQEARGAGSGAPTLKLTWTIPTLTSSTTAMDASALKTFLEKYDAPSFTYTINSTNNTYPSSGTTSAPNNHLDSWKFSSSSVNGAANISGLPSYTLVKIWVARWSTDAATLTINGGTAQSITTNNYDLYTFDGFDNQTSFVITAGKRFMIHKIEFWGC